MSLYLQIVGTSGFFANNYLIEEIVGVTGSSNLVVKAQLMRIGFTKFIAIAPPGYSMIIIVNFTIHIFITLIKETIYNYVLNTNTHLYGSRNI